LIGITWVIYEAYKDSGEIEKTIGLEINGLEHGTQVARYKIQATVI
jgi:hypothetical protein